MTDGSTLSFKGSPGLGETVCLHRCSQLCEAIAFTVRSHDLLQDELKLGENRVPRRLALRSDSLHALRFTTLVFFASALIASSVL